MRKAPKRGHERDDLTPTGSPILAQGKPNGAAVGRHPGSTFQQTPSLKGLYNRGSLWNPFSPSGFVRANPNTQGGAAAPLTLGYDV